MELKELDAHEVSLIVSHHELGTMGNALNEVCNGIAVEDFETKMGAELSRVHDLLEDIIQIYHQMKQTEALYAVVSWSRHELRAIIGALEEVCEEIDAIEFATRMSAQRSEVDQILDEIIPIYDKMKQVRI